MCMCVYRHAKRLLVQIVERCRNGPGFHGDGEGGTSVQEMLIPASKVGLVIGRGGDTIKQLQVETTKHKMNMYEMHYTITTASTSLIYVAVVVC